MQSRSTCTRGDALLCDRSSRSLLTIATAIALLCVLMPLIAPINQAVSHYILYNMRRTYGLSLSLRQLWCHLPLACCAHLPSPLSVLAPACSIRRLATSSSSPAPNLKPLLRQLYLKVHPDLFDAYPKEKAVNSGSFVALNDYLAAIAQRRQLRGKPIQLTFYRHTDEPEQAAPTPVPASPPASAVSAVEPQPLDKVSILFPTDFYHRSSTSLTSLAVKQIHDNLTALFTALGISTPLQLPDDLSSVSTTSASATATAADDDDEEGGLSAASVSLPTFLASVALTAHHISHTTSTRRAQHALRSAHLRLQGVRTLWQSADDAAVSEEEEVAVERRFESVVRKIPKLCVGLQVGLDESEERDMSGEEQRRQREREAAEAEMGLHDSDGDPKRPRGSPMSQRAGMPFSRLLSQIRRAQTNGASDDIEEAEQDKSRSPLQSTTTVFSYIAAQSHVDNRGRLVLSVFETDEQWYTFLSQPSLFTLATSRAAAYHHCKSTEQRLSQLLTVHDLYAEAGLVGGDEYGGYLQRLESSTHAFHRLFRRHPELQRLSVRIQSAHTALAVDDVQGVLLVPLYTPAADIIGLYESRGHEALRLLHAHVESKRQYEVAVQEVRRRYRLRRLDKARSVSEREMLECCGRLLSATSSSTSGNGQFRVHFDGLDVLVGREYNVEQEGGRVTIPWNFVMDVEGEQQQRQ